MSCQKERLVKAWAKFDMRPSFCGAMRALAVGVVIALSLLTRAEDRYTVKFSANGGTGAMSAQTFTKGKPQDLRANAFSRDNYTFGGWAVDPKGAAVYSDGQNVAVSANMTLYALWSVYGDDPEPGADLVWYRRKTEALAAAKAASKRILLLNGRDTCGSTMNVKNRVCEQPRVKKILRRDYVLWYNDCDEHYMDVWAYRSDLSMYALPLLCVLDPYNDSTYIVRSTGSKSEDSFIEFLDSQPAWRGPGTIVVSAPTPLSVLAGNTLRITFARVGGNKGSIAVKAKTQTSTALMGVGGSADFDYIKTVLTWKEGDTSTRYIDIPTYVQPWEGVKMLRVKLSTLATGTYAGNLTPALAPSKIYANIESPCAFGTVSVAPVEDSPKAGEPLKLVFRRTGGSDWPIAVKYKVQTSTAIAGTDFDYMKDVITWDHGEDHEQFLEVPTYPSAAGKTLRIKLSTLTQGAYEGYVTPHVKSAKVYVSLW